MAEETYTVRGIQSMLGITPAVIGRLVAAGFVSPSRGLRNEYRFTFQDVVVLRTAYGLQRADIPARKILQSLKRLRESLPSEVPLSGLRITAVGNQIAVQEGGGARRQIETGQLLLDFDVRSSRNAIAFLGNDVEVEAPQKPSRVANDEAAGHEAWFDRGTALEGENRAAEAEAAYRRAICLAPDYVDPVLNLGVMLCNSGRCSEAVALYRRALQRGQADPLLLFNLAVALEDLARNDDALAAYEACLRLDPKLADAHYNAARLHELSGHRSQAIRHYSEYRRLKR